MNYGQKVCLALGHTWTFLLGKVLQPAAMFLQLTTQDEFVAGEKMLWRGSSTLALFFPSENSYISIYFYLSYFKHVSELLILSDGLFIFNWLWQTHFIFIVENMDKKINHKFSSVNCKTRVLSFSIFVLCATMSKENLNVCKWQKMQREK